VPSAWNTEPFSRLVTTFSFAFSAAPNGSRIEDNRHASPRPLVAGRQNSWAPFGR
jgi:hypothetical protein